MLPLRIAAAAYISGYGGSREPSGRRTPAAQPSCPPRGTGQPARRPHPDRRQLGEPHPTRLDQLPRRTGKHSRTRQYRTIRITWAVPSSSAQVGRATVDAMMMSSAPGQARASSHGVQAPPPRSLRPWISTPGMPASWSAARRHAAHEHPAAALPPRDSPNLLQKIRDESNDDGPQLDQPGVRP
jgi:hypothetical protein